MRKILPGLYTFTGLVVGRVYMVEDRDGVSIIDTGLSLAPARIFLQLASLGYEPTDIKRILITHAHPDHIGGLHELQEASGAKVIVSEGEKAVVADGAVVPGPPKESLPGLMKRLPLPKATFKPTPVARVVRDGDLIQEVFGGLQVIGTPGHAPGHVAFWQRHRGVLFCGDVMMALWPYKLQLPFRMVTVDMEQNRRSIQRVAEMDVRVLCLGHGVPMVRNTAARIRKFADRVALPERT